MSVDDRDIDDVPPEIASRRPRTDRLTSNADTSSDPNASSWRSAGRNPSRRRTARSLPASGPEFVLWLQHGGWPWLLGAFLLVVIFIALLIFSPQPGGQQADTKQPTRAPLGRTPLATVSADTGAGAGVAPIVPTPPISPTVALNVRFRVTGTGTEGLFLRPQPNVDGAPIKTLPEGTEVTIIGEDQVMPDRVWKHIRDDSGAEGWASADFLKAVGP